jgi:uncharacterized protein (DUF1684 family)
MRPILLLLLSVIVWPIALSATEYTEEIAAWRAQRLKRLTAEEGFLSLAGLYWLKEGDNSFGSAEDNDLVFPAGAPAHIGVFTLNTGVVSLQIESGAPVTHIDSVGAERAVQTLDFANLKNDDPAALRLGSLRFYPIERDGRFGVRLKDIHSETRQHFEGIEHFVVDSLWRVEARFEIFAQPRSIEVPSIIGTVSATPWPGDIVFSVGGQEQRLAVFGEIGDKLFFTVFADATSGQETYGGGRFLVVEHLGDGRVIADFNKAYSPPCAFTPYATCPLPPPQNRLDVRIEAGERFSGELRRVHVAVPIKNAAD